jgi:hypothetical protein
LARYVTDLAEISTIVGTSVEERRGGLRVDTEEDML